MILSDKLLLSLIENFPEAMVATDLDRRIIKVNKAYEKIFGFTEAESLGQLTEIFYAHNEDFRNQGKIRFNPDADTSDEIYVVEYKRNDGTTFLGETMGVPIIDQNGKKIGFIGVVRDISDSRIFDETIFRFHELTNSRDFNIDEKIDKTLKMACDYFDMDIGILSKIEENTYIVRNCYSKTGMPETGQTFELNNTYCAKTFHKDEIVAYYDVKNSEIAQHPCYRTFQLNSYIGIAVTVNGKKYGTLNISSSKRRENDFSKREKDILISAANWMSYALAQAGYENLLLEQKRIAEETNRVKTNFIANISHEVRTPLNGIIGYADILANMINDPDIQKLSEKIQKSAHSLLGILNDVIDISKMEQGEFKIIRAHYSPEQVIYESTDLFMIHALEKDNEIIVRLDPSMPKQVIGDPTRIKQVLNNVLSNAIKFTDGGQVKISALYDNEKQNIRIQVSDTGIGIAENMKEKVFEEYIQGDSGVTKKYGGSGLGLSISKKLVEMMGGTIKLDSKLGLGTTVTISVPAKIQDSNNKPDNEKKKNRQRIKRDKNTPPNVLLVEDIQMNIEIATAMLQRENCCVDIAETGEDALNKLKKNHYDLIFLDIQMPGIDGVTVTKEARRLGIESPIVALTAHVMKHETEEFMQAGMNGYLPKPLIYTELKQTLDRWV